MALVSPPSSPTVELRRCEALLVDEETVCAVPIRSPRGRFCNEHGKEYVHLTRAYKSVSKTVEELKTQAWISRKQIRALCDTSEVDSAIVRVERWRDAIAEEILARQVQHRRFFATKDKGHQQWLDHLAVSETKAEELLGRLRVRRLEIVSAAEAHRRIDAWSARETEATRARDRVKELQRQIQEAARRTSNAAQAARMSAAAAALAPAPPSRVVESSPSVVPGHRPPYAPGRSFAYGFPPGIDLDDLDDLEGQTPVGEPREQSALPVFFVLFVLWLLWMVMA